ncbi:MAG: twin-arginine translocation pathway signal [Cyanobium sp.]
MAALDRPSLSPPVTPLTHSAVPAGDGFGRRQLLRLAAIGGLGLLAGCRGQGPQLLACRGELPSAWSARLPKPWQPVLLDTPAAVLAARARASLLQLGDGWATDLPRASLEPIGTPELLARLAPQAGPVSRLFAPEGAPILAFPWSCNPWLLLLRDRPDLQRRRAEGWDLLLDPSLRAKLVLPSSPRVAIALVDGDPERLRRLRQNVLAQDDRHGLSLLLSGAAEALVLPRPRVVPLLRRDPRLSVILPEQGAPLGWSLVLRPAAAAGATAATVSAATGASPPLEWLAAALEPPLLPLLLAGGWVPPLPRSELERAVAPFPPAVARLLLPPALVLARCRDLPPLTVTERAELQALWDAAAPAT